VDFRAGLYILEKRKISPSCQGSEVFSLNIPGLVTVLLYYPRFFYTTVNNGLYCVVSNMILCGLALI